MFLHWLGRSRITCKWQITVFVLKIYITILFDFIEIAAKYGHRKYHMVKPGQSEA